MRVMAELVGFAALLFVSRFVARGYLVPLTDQECHIGGIGVDVLAHGVRFPLMVYAPNEYDNGSFFSGLLAALSFALLGRSVLALKLVTHVITAAGAVASLALLRGCLGELGFTARRLRWTATAALVIALAAAPTLVTALSMYAVGNHAEGAAIDVLLLALFARRLRNPSAVLAGVSWAVVGVALYLNKGTFLVLPLLAAAEVALAWRERRRVIAAALGFLVGFMPEIVVIAQRHGRGWVTMAAKAERTAPAFPWAFLDEIGTLAEYRLELIIAWTLALAVGSALWVRAESRWRHGERTVSNRPITLSLVVAVTMLHLAALAIFAQGGFDAYALYGYSPVVVLYALLVATICAHAARRWGGTAATWMTVALLAVTVVIYRPRGWSWEFGTVTALARDHAGAACSWRFAEGFVREHQYGLAPADRTAEEHAVARCRSLSEPAQVLDCIGGMARELQWRRGGTVAGEPPGELTPIERRAYAYYYGNHRKGDATACRDFTDPELQTTCAAAVQLECLFFGDQYARLFTGQPLQRPRCTINEPPMAGYWAQRRLSLLTRDGGVPPSAPNQAGEGELRACKPIFDACYGNQL